MMAQDLQFFNWSVTFLGKTYSFKDGYFNDIKIKQSAKKKYSTCSLTLSAFGKDLIESILAKSKKEKGIKLPEGLSDQASANEKSSSATAIQSNTGGLPGLSNLSNLGDVKRVSAFLDLTYFCEGTLSKNGAYSYNLIAGGKTFSDFSDHPGIKNPNLYRETGLNSDAAGTGQFLSTTFRKSQPSDNPGVFDRIKAAGIAISGYSPETQNMCTAFHMRELSTIGWSAIQSGSVINAMQSYRGTWESFDRILKGAYGVSQSQAVDFYNSRYKEYTIQAAKPNVKPQTGNNPPAEAVKSPETIAKGFVPDRSSCTVQSYFYAIARAFGTDIQGATADNINIANGAIVDQSKLIGRYKIPPQFWNTVYNNDGTTREAQEIVFLKILQLRGGYEKLMLGSIEAANRDIYQLYPDLPRVGDPRFAKMLTDFDAFKTKCISTSSPTKKDPITGAIVSQGEPLRITVSSQDYTYNFDYFFFELADGSITGKSVDSALGIVEKSSVYDNINEIELAKILLKRNGFDLKIFESFNPRVALESKNFAITKKTDKQTLENIFADVGISFNPVTFQDYEAITDDTSLPLKRLVITDFFSSSFLVAAIDANDTDPVNYPVSLDVLTTDSILGLKVRQRISLISEYNLVPDALKFDEWLLESIDHNMKTHRSVLVLTKEIKKETESATNSAATAATAALQGSSDGKWSSPYDSYQVTSEFNPARVNPVSGILRPHKGIDLAFTGSGTAYIKAARDGTCTEVGYDPTGYGNYPVLKHDNDFETLYGHCSKVLIKVGDVIKRGQNIAIEGSTGGVTGAHCHFEIIRKGSAENPRLYLNFGAQAKG